MPRSAPESATAAAGLPRSATSSRALTPNQGRKRSASPSQAAPSARYWNRYGALSRTSEDDQRLRTRNRTPSAAIGATASARPGNRSRRSFDPTRRSRYHQNQVRIHSTSEAQTTNSSSSEYGSASSIRGEPTLRVL